MKGIGRQKESTADSMINNINKTTTTKTEKELNGHSIHNAIERAKKLIACKQYVLQNYQNEFIAKLNFSCMVDMETTCAITRKMACHAIEAKKQTRYIHVYIVMTENRFKTR